MHAETQETLLRQLTMLRKLITQKNVPGAIYSAQWIVGELERVEADPNYVRRLGAATTDDAPPA